LGVAHNSQVLLGLNRLESMTSPRKARGSDQSYRSRSQTYPMGHGFPSVTSAWLSPVSWTCRYST
jgi:hypothetical protein